MYRRIAIALLLVTAESCESLPPPDASSLLVSEGVNSAWNVTLQRAMGYHHWIVFARETPREIAPQICTTERTDLSVAESNFMYRVDGRAKVQEIALKDCAAVSPDDFKPIFGSRTEVADSRLTNAINAVFEAARAESIAEG